MISKYTVSGILGVWAIVLYGMDLSWFGIITNHCSGDTQSWAAAYCHMLSQLSNGHIFSLI